MGAQVTTTVRKKMLVTDYFQYNPEVLMMGMMSALAGAGIWLMICSIIGVGLSVNPEAVNWGTVGKVVLSWFCSPLLAGIFAAGCYFLLLLFCYTIFCTYVIYKNSWKTKDF